MQVLHLTHDQFLLHSNVPGHPERPERLAAVARGVRSADGVDVLEVEAPPIELSKLERVHSREYIRGIEEFCRAGGGRLDPDTGAVPDSWGAALRAAGAGVEAIARLQAEETAAAFLTVRPPGHHALSSQAMGFCLFNNIAVAAAELLAGGHRVAIVDWDVHHGNGTQDMFYDEERLFYLSLHQSPAYPGTGRLDEVGVGDSRGTNLNVPLPSGTAGDVYRAALAFLVPMLERFAPDWVLVSAGYDAHIADPLAELHLLESDYGVLAAAVAALAPPSRLIFFLEGGYDLGALEASVRATLVGAAHGPPPGEPHSSPDSAWNVLDQVATSVSGQFS